jgi:hypothetical protein
MNDAYIWVGSENFISEVKEGANDVADRAVRLMRQGLMNPFLASHVTCEKMRV